MSATRPAIELSIGIIASVRLAALDRREDVLERRAGQRLQVRVVLAAHLVGVGARLALVGDPPGAAQRFGHRSIVVWVTWASSSCSAWRSHSRPWPSPPSALRRTPPVSHDVDALPEDVMGLRQEVAALRAEAAGAIRHLGVVRYDAFGDVGGRLSWSLALLDDRGDGVVLTAIHGRSEARSYAKSIAGWSCDQPMSPEEQDAVASAKP